MGGSATVGDDDGWGVINHLYQGVVSQLSFSRLSSIYPLHDMGVGFAADVIMAGVATCIQYFQW